VTKSDPSSTFSLAAPFNEQPYRRSDSNPFAIPFRRKYRWIRLPFRRKLARLAAVSIQTVDPNRIEFLEKPLPGNDERGISYIRKFRNERDDAASAVLGDALFGKREETDVEVVEVEFLDIPLGDKTLFIRLNKSLLFLRTDAERPGFRAPSQVEDGQ
jgi:hypothetical protein